MKVKSIGTLLALFLVFGLQAQKKIPVQWSFQSKNVGKDQYDLIFTANIADGWWIYSQIQEMKNPPPASFTWKEDSHFKLIGGAVESGNKSTTDDDLPGIKITKFKHLAIFTQRVQVTDTSKPIVGYLTYTACGTGGCLPPRDVDFTFVLTPGAGKP